MKLDANHFRYVTKDEFRVLAAVEMGMRNHEIVPTQLIESIAHSRRGGTYKILQSLLRNKLVAHDGGRVEGYRMTYHGYDYLALRALVLRGTIIGVGRRMGVGKESDVHFCEGPNGEVYALKLHRLGRVSFRAIKEKRDYLRHRTHASWMYMARLAAMKEFAYMKALQDEGFPVPTPIDQNRHAVVMSFVDATPLYQIREMKVGVAQRVLERLMRLLVRLARAGLIHGDFNEFNIMIGENQAITLIDFPQIVSINHANAEELFDRDVRSTCDYFRKRLGWDAEDPPRYQDVIAEIAGSGGTLGGLVVEGVGADDDALLVAAHGEGPRDAVDKDGDEDADADEEEEEEEDGGREEEAGAEEDESTGEADADGGNGFAQLVPEGGTEALGAHGENASGDELEAVLARGESELENQEDREGAGGSSSSSGEESEGPGQVQVRTGQKVRRTRQTATSARKNLQKQQHAKPAKPNNQKVKSLRKARHEVRECM